MSDRTKDDETAEEGFPTSAYARDTKPPDSAAEEFIDSTITDEIVTRLEEVGEVLDEKEQERQSLPSPEDLPSERITEGIQYRIVDPVEPVVRPSQMGLEGMSEEAMTSQNLADSTREQLIDVKEEQLGRREAELDELERSLRAREESLLELEVVHGGKVKILEEREDKLRKREHRLRDWEARLMDREATLKDRESEIEQQQAGVEGRLADLADREAELSARLQVLEKRVVEIAQKESDLAEREASLAGAPEARGDGKAIEDGEAAEASHEKPVPTPEQERKTLQVRQTSPSQFRVEIGGGGDWELVEEDDGGGGS